MKTVVRIKQENFEAMAMRNKITTSYAEMADYLGITRVYLSLIKNKRDKHFYPSGKLRAKILKLFKCSFDDVFEIVRIPDKRNQVSEKCKAPSKKKPQKKARFGCKV